MTTRHVVIDGKRTYVHTGTPKVDDDPVPLRKSERETMREAVLRFERKLLRRTLWECGGNRARTARALGVNTRTVLKIAERTGVKLPEASFSGRARELRKASS